MDFFSGLVSRLKLSGYREVKMDIDVKVEMCPKCGDFDNAHPWANFCPKDGTKLIKAELILEIRDGKLSRVLVK